MNEKTDARRKGAIGKASDNLEKALEGMSRRLLMQIREEQTPSRELGELAKVMKQVAQIRQEFREESAERSEDVRVVFAPETEAYAE